MTISGISKIAAAVVAAGVSAAAGAYHGGQQLAELTKKVDALAGDVRLLKCVQGFPGDCPGQANVAKALEP